MVIIIFFEKLQQECSRIQFIIESMFSMCNSGAKSPNVWHFRLMTGCNYYLFEMYFVHLSASCSNTTDIKSLFAVFLMHCLLETDQYEKVLLYRT